MQENRNPDHIVTTLDSRYFSSLWFMVEKPDKGTLEGITVPFMFMWFEGKSKKLTFNTELLLVE